MPQANTVQDASGNSSPTNVADTVAASSSSPSVASNTTGNQYVPYDRFAEVNREKRELEARLRELESNSNSGKAAQAPSANEVEKIAYRQYLGIDQDKAEAVRQAEEVARKVALEEARKAQQEASLAMQIEELRKKYDGSDGVMPAFDPKDILAYGAQEGIFNPEKAYLDKYRDQYADKRAKELAAASKSTYVESPAPSSGLETPSDELSNEEFLKLTPKERRAYLDKMEKQLPH